MRALDMRPGLLGAPELQKDLNAAMMSDQLGPLLADGDGEGDRLLTGGERVPQVEFLELRDGVHRPVRHFDSAEPDTTALFDTTPEVAPGGRQSAPRILGVARSAERSGLRLRDIVERRLQLVEDPARRGAAQQRKALSSCVADPEGFLIGGQRLTGSTAIEQDVALEQQQR
jgi:hypothetical protein